MKLPQLLTILPEYKASAPEIEVLSLTQDVRHVHLGSVFVAVKGVKVDGHQFIPQACEAGAIGLVIEHGELVPADYTGFVQVVANSREALDRLAAQFYQHPSKEMICVGVTGTNGKTSMTYMLETILAKVKIPCGVLGTINHHLGEHVWSSELTTPGSIQLQKRLREMREMGARAVAMEVSSHALDQHRADGVHFNTVIFTNLTLDHLDYHGSMQAYFRAKQRLFTELLWKTEKRPHFAIVNTDDIWGARMKVASTAGLWSYGQKSADFQYTVTQIGFSRTDFDLKTPFGNFKSFVPMCGRHNVANAVGVVAAAASFGIPVALSLESLSQFTGVPGRLQSIANSKSLHVFVDYAHTPDALKNVLEALHQVKTEMKSQVQIWTVFGCAGDRDKSKRSLMAIEAAQRSDYVMVTSDNPRTEDPLHIIHDVMDGFSSEDRKNKVQMEADRKKAIEKVFRLAKPQDVVLIAGKGHEDYQIIGTEKIHFSDVETVRELLR